ncbi:MAG: single-stranded DNA-binding protein [Fimbriimonas sp.]
MINRVVLVGRLVRDPELRTTSTGKSVVGFSIAVDKRFKPQGPDQPTADFFKVTAWEKTAEYVSNYLTKGQRCAVDGRLEQRSYVDKEGNKRETVEVVAENVQGLSDRPRDDSGPAGGGGYAGAERPSSGGGAAPAPDEYDPFADE